MRLPDLFGPHPSHHPNREALGTLPAYPDDRRVLAGDVTGGYRHLDGCVETLNGKFRLLVRMPGHHEIRTLPPGSGSRPRGRFS